MKKLLTWSSFLTLAVVGIACLSPIRFDAKALGPTLPQTLLSAIPPGTPILFVSPTNGGLYGHVAAYGLDLATFPRGGKAWIVFSEGYVEGPWPPDYLLNSQSEIFGRAAGGWRRLQERPQGLTDMVSRGLVLVPSSDVRDRLIDRWPGFVAHQVGLLSDGRPSLLGRPGLRMRPASVLRLAILCVIVTGAWLMAWRSPVSLAGLRWLNVGLALPVVLAVHAGLVHLAGFLTSQAVAWTVALELAVVVLAIARQVQSGPSGEGTKPATALWAIPLAAVFLAVLVFRLDFDGDLFTHWLPIARLHYLLGYHDVPALLDRYGLAHQATYPPGFPILISTLLWVAGADPQASMQLGAESHTAVLLYRLLLATLSLSFLIAVAGLTSAVFRDRTSFLLPLVALPPVVPVLLGQPTSSEVYFVPLLGASILALWAGDAFELPFTTRAGVLLAFSSLLVKREALVIVPLIVLPWYLAGALRRRKSVAGDFATAAVALLPFLAWRFRLAAFHLRENFMFDDLAWERLASPLLLRLAGQALKTVFANDTWPILFLVLPAAAAWNVRHRAWRSLMVPAGIAVYAPVMATVYVFSRSDPLQHMETSYTRLLMVAVLSAGLYGLRSLAGARNGVGLDAVAGEPNRANGT